MKTTDLSLLLICLLTLSSCLSQKYLPRPKEIGANPFGSYIRITTNQKTEVNGELLAVDSNSVWILDHDVNNMTQIPRNTIKTYSIHVATTDQNTWVPFAFVLASVSHGAFGFLSLPVNIPFSIVTTQGGYKLQAYKLTYDQLRKFARFPQGLPPNYTVR